MLCRILNCTQETLTLTNLADRELLRGYWVAHTMNGSQGNLGSRQLGAFISVLGAFLT